MPKVGGVLETSLYVDDVKRSARFYETIFGFQTIGSYGRLSVLSVESRQVLLIFKKGGSVNPTLTPGGTIPPTDGAGNLHLTFSVSTQEVPEWEKWLNQKGVSIESKVRWERGGQSLYFRDPDGHILELATPGTWSIY